MENGSADSSLSPGHLQARNNRALAYERRGDAARALADYTAALKLKPTFLPALVNRGALHGRKQRYRQAIADFERALPLARGTRWEAEARKMLAFWRKKLR